MRSSLFIIPALLLTGLTVQGYAQGLVQKISKDTIGIRPVLADHSIPPSSTAQMPATLPINFATCNYGIFCRTEVKLDKVTPVKVRFRLGSAQQTDWLEGKPGAVHP